MRKALRRSEAASYIVEKFGIPCSTGTLANYATTDAGPKFKLAGRFPIYSVDELDAWAESRLCDPSCMTSEVRAD